MAIHMVNRYQVTRLHKFLDMLDVFSWIFQVEIKGKKWDKYILSDNARMFIAYHPEPVVRENIYGWTLVLGKLIASMVHLWTRLQDNLWKAIAQILGPISYMTYKCTFETFSNLFCSKTDCKGLYGPHICTCYDRRSVATREKLWPNVCISIPTTSLVLP